MQRKFRDEGGSGSKKKGLVLEEENKPNIFNGNLYQYKEQKEKKRLMESNQLGFK